MMKVLFLYFIATLTVTSSALAAAANFKISVSKDASVEMSIVSSAQSKLPKENYFHGIKPCKHALKCLEFHTAVKGSSWILVPISIVDLTNEDDFAGDLAKLGVSAQKEKKQEFDWGFVSSWIQASASNHYFYLIPSDRTYGLRIGPISNTLLNNYEFNFQKTQWEFKDE
jgi:hypothetical protein